jgi:Zn-dependent protease with chaperone function/type II secretory pathway pseudopilin PulG
MHDLVYPRERILSKITLVLGLLFWLGLIAGTFGIALIGLALGFLLYLFIQSALIAHIKGNGVALSAAQYPDLHAQFEACCDRLEINTRPQVYILNGDGAMNAFATKFLGAQYVVLLSGVVDAMAEHADGVRFYIGHELGHLRMKHLSGHLLRWPALWLPLLGGAYSRARESTCDRHGLACSSSAEGAARALAALASGAQRWKQLNIAAYLEQVPQTKGFWMSFHELTAAYPWLSKRAARVMDADAKMPSRHRFAYLLALFVPYAGRLGGGFGFIMMIYLVGVLAAVALPAYQDYTVKAKLTVAAQSSQDARDKLTDFYKRHQQSPESLAAAGIPDALPDGSRLQLHADNMTLTITTAKGELIYVPKLDAQDQLFWVCMGGDGVRPAQLPKACAGAAAPPAR